MNRALRVGDQIEFRATLAADDFCRSSAYPELLTCMGGSQTWDESADGRMMKVVARRTHEERPVLEVELSWTKRRMLVWAALMRLDNRARRNQFAAKVETLKARRCAERRRSKCKHRA